MYRLHNALRDIGCDSRILSLHRTVDDPDAITLQPSHHISNRLIRRIRNKVRDYRITRYKRPYPYTHQPFSDERSLYSKELLAQIPSSDVINLHWMVGLLDYDSFFHKIKTTPIVWRLSDMNPLTGGCHSNFGCDRFTRSCGMCPQLGSNRQNDLSAEIFQRKLSILDNLDDRQIHIVAISPWMKEQIAKSRLLGRFQATYIPNGVDVKIFSPLNKKFARDVLKIPQDKTVILFVAHLLADPQKGIYFLEQALSQLSEHFNLCLLSVGSHPPQLSANILHLHAGHIADERLMSIAYNASDIFVNVSVQESFSNTLIEAMSCGVPTIGFPVGIISEAIKPGITGLLVPTGNVALLRSAIAQLLRDPGTRATMGHNARRIAVEQYALEVQARRYVEVYERVLER